MSTNKTKIIIPGSPLQVRARKGVVHLLFYLTLSISQVQGAGGKSHYYDYSCQVTKSPPCWSRVEKY